METSEGHAGSVVRLGYAGQFRQRFGQWRRWKGMGVRLRGGISGKACGSTNKCGYVSDGSGELPRHNTPTPCPLSCPVLAAAVPPKSCDPRDFHEDRLATAKTTHASVGNKELPGLLPVVDVKNDSATIHTDAAT